MRLVDDADGLRAILEQAERDLADRVASVSKLDRSARELAAFATERDNLAEQWDQLAVAEDEVADARDDRAVDRDELARDRDRQPRIGIAGDDPGFAARLLSAGNRDDAAADRLASRDERRHAQASRARAADSRHVAATERDADHAVVLERRLASLQWTLSSRIRIGQATGLLMERYSLDADRAFRMLVYLAHESKVKVHEIADRVVANGELRRARQERGDRPDAVSSRSVTAVDHEQTPPD
jgi:response regulator NasT